MIVSIVGPESSGKTSLALDLSAALSLAWLPEYAREYLSGRPHYTENDLEEIAREQLAREKAFIEAQEGKGVLDTDLIVIAIWWKERFGRVPGWVDGHLDRQVQRHYLLTRPDLLWEPDPLRVSPHDRERLFGLYKELLSSRSFPFTVIQGHGETRLEGALQAVVGPAPIVP